MKQNPIEYIRWNYPHCITSSCREKRCRLQLDGVNPASLAIIHGSKYQKHNSYTEKLCDRIVFCGEHGFIMAAVELKGGKTVNISDAREQIQNGLIVAEGILGGHPVAEWFPLLLYDGGMKPYEIKLLQTRSVEFRGQRKNIVKRNCDTRLSTVLSH